MGLSSQPDQVLDQRFFHITGLAMVLGTLVAGAITVWLANDIRPTEIPVLITDNIARQTSALKKPEKLPDPITEVNFRVHLN